MGLSDMLGRDLSGCCRDTGLDSIIWTWRNPCCIVGRMGGDRTLGSAGAKPFLLLFNAPGTSRSTSISEQSLSKGEI